MTPTHLTPDQCAAELGLKTKDTLANWRAMKPPKGPRWVKHGTRVLYPIEEVAAYKAAAFKSGPPTQST